MTFFPDKFSTPIESLKEAADAEKDSIEKTINRVCLNFMNKFFSVKFYNYTK